MTRDNGKTGDGRDRVKSGDGEDDWDADLYQQEFLHSYGQDLVDLLGPFAGERILDLGCGTGDLASLIADSGARVVGIDSSRNMIENAREKHPEIEFAVEDARDFATTEPFDAVFSNAAIHWIPEDDQPDLLRSVRGCLRPGGRFVAEMGGSGNITDVLETVEKVTSEKGYPNTRRWFFPSVAEYVGLLDSHGFEVTYANLFDRPTRLEGRNGFANWLDVFGDGLFPELGDEEEQEVVESVVEELRSSMYDPENEVWVLDYTKLRFVAIKK
ncbi:MAG: trans-aconitate 2-methyltransferase [Halobacteria archaeon]